MLAFAPQQVKTKQDSGITKAQGYLTRGYVWPMKTPDPGYLAPKQFSKTAEGSDESACACVCVEIRFHLGHRCCLRFCS